MFRLKDDVLDKGLCPETVLMKIMANIDACVLEPVGVYVGSISNH